MSDLTDIVKLFPALAAGIIAWFLSRWIQNNDKKNEDIDDHKTEFATIRASLEAIRDTVNRIEASVERLEDKREKHQEEFYKVRSQVDAAWKAIDRLQEARH